jgi:hypothetical protein
MKVEKNTSATVATAKLIKKAIDNININNDLSKMTQMKNP